MAITLPRNKVQAPQTRSLSMFSLPHFSAKSHCWLWASACVDVRRRLRKYCRILYDTWAATSLSSCHISFLVQDFRASVSYLPSGRFSRIIQMKEKLCLIKALRCFFKDLWRLRWKGDSSRVVLSLRMIIEIWMGLIFTIKLKDWAGYWAGENRWVQSKRNYSTIGHTVHFPSVQRQYQISLRGNVFRTFKCKKIKMILRSSVAHVFKPQGAPFGSWHAKRDVKYQCVDAEFWNRGARFNWALQLPNQSLEIKLYLRELINAVGEE